MSGPWGQRLARVLLLAAWAVLLAVSPWWLDLVLLLGLAGGAAYYAQRSAARRDLCRLALKWGLPGLLFAVQRSLGGDLLAWGAALLGALVGFSLVALLESLLFHRVRRQAAAAATPEWRDMAMAPIGPPVHIIELSPVEWLVAMAPSLADPRGGTFDYVADTPESGTYRFAGGVVLERLSPRYAFSPAGHWFAASLTGGRGDALCDLDTGKVYRLRGWQLCGWEEERPWLARGAEGVPVGLHEVLGQGD
jgi:hypothetical protein